MKMAAAGKDRIRDRNSERREGGGRETSAKGGELEEEKAFGM